MTPPTPESGDDLDRILKVVDGPRELPPGAEDRLLAAVLQTASAPRATPRSTRPVPRAGRLAAAARWWSTRRVGAVLTTGAVAAAVIVGVVAVAPEPRGPTILSGPPAESLDGVDNATLCSDAVDLATTLRLDQPDEQAVSDVTPLRRLSAILDELARRVDEGALTPNGDLDEAVDFATVAAATLRLQARQIVAGDVDAAARTHIRITSVVLGDPPVLEMLACAPSGI